VRLKTAWRMRMNAVAGSTHVPEVIPCFATTDKSALLGQDALGISKEEAPSAVDKAVVVEM
jgi:hypothetical protein